MEKRENENFEKKPSPRPSSRELPTPPFLLLFLSLCLPLLFLFLPLLLLLLVKLPAQHRGRRPARRGKGPDLRVGVAPHLLERQDREGLLDRDADLLDAEEQEGDEGARRDAGPLLLVFCIFFFSKKEKVQK